MGDLRYAARLLRKTPAFTIVAIATLAVGIGANTAIFSVVNAALVSPLPFPDSDRLVAVWTTVQRQAVERRGTSVPDFRDLRDRTSSFEALAAWAGESLTLAASQDAPASQVSAELVSAGYVEMLGATPIAGRSFSRKEDEERGAHPVALISSTFWKSRFAGAASAVGSPIRLNDTMFTIVGILPAGFTGLNDQTDVWLPMGMLAIAEPPRFFDARGSRWHQIVGRLKPGVTIAQASADVAAVARQLELAYPDSNERYSGAAFSLKEETVGSLQPLLLTLLGAVGFVPLIACTNLANLLLARATARQRETAVRAALGAGRARLVRQFVAEALLLSAIGAAAGVLISVWAVDAIVALGPGTLPSFVHPRLDWRVLLFVMAATATSGLLLGLLPAVQGSRADLNETLKEGSRGSSAGPARARTRAALVVAQVALSLLLLIGTGLMVRTFINLQRIDVGFQADRAVTARLALPQKFAEDRLAAVADEILARVAAIPGVQHAALGSDAPFTGGSRAIIVTPEGNLAGTPDSGVRVYFHAITPDFFAALGAPLLRGRAFDAHDTAGAERAVIVSRAFAAKVWKDADPIGRRIRYGRGDQAAWLHVVGVAPDLRYRSLRVGVDGPEDPDLFFAYAQQPDRGLTIVASTAGDPVPLSAAVRDTVQRFDRDLPVRDARTISSSIAERTAQFRLTAGMMGIFGAAALLLAGIGVYGLINYSVAQRRQEIGVRVALGAGRREIYALVLRDGFLLTAIGLAIGLVAAFPASRLLATQLYGVNAFDPATYAAIAGLLTLTSLAATLIPARRAARRDPIAALRSESEDICSKASGTTSSTRGG